MVHNYHYLPEYSKLHQLLGQGLIGDLRVLTLHYLGVIDMPGAAEFQGDWRHTLAAGGGILMDMIHAVYLAEWFYGARAEQVMAFVDAPTYAARDPQVEDLALVQIAFPGGYATLHHGWGAGVGGVDLSGSDGYLRYALQVGSDQRLQPGVRDLQRARLAAQRTRSRRPGGSGRQHCPLVHKAVVAIRRSCPEMAARCSPAEPLARARSKWHSAPICQGLRAGSFGCRWRKTIPSSSRESPALRRPPSGNTATLCAAAFSACATGTSSLPARSTPRPGCGQLRRHWPDFRKPTRLIVPRAPA